MYVVTKRRNNLQPPKTIYNHLEKFNNHPQPIEYHLEQAINVYNKQDDNVT